MDDRLSAAAERLRAAYDSGAIPPLRDYLEPGNAESAYQIQAINTRHWVDGGRRVVGRKIGLTAEAVQRQLGVDQPDFGVLFADMAIASGGDLSWTKVLQPKAEAEVAIILGQDVLDANADIAVLASATRAVAPAIEIVDSRIADWKITFADTVADNGSAAYYVLGDERPLDGIDLYACGMVLEVNGAVASLGAGAACLGHPLNAAAWLARMMVRLGDPLRAGDVLLTGALGPMTALKPGDRVRAIVGGLGECGFQVSEAAQ